MQMSPAEQATTDRAHASSLGRYLLSTFLANDRYGWVDH